jgi:hypothetical protein
MCTEFDISNLNDEYSSNQIVEVLFNNYRMSSIEYLHALSLAMPLSNLKVSNFEEISSMTSIP